MSGNAKLNCTEETPDKLQELFSRYLDEELSEAELERVEEHLGDCATCRDTLASMRGVERIVSRAIEETNPSTDFNARVGAKISSNTGSKHSAHKIAIILVVLIAIAGGVGAFIFSNGEKTVKDVKKIAAGFNVLEGENWLVTNKPNKPAKELKLPMDLFAGMKLTCNPKRKERSSLVTPSKVKIYLRPKTSCAFSPTAKPERGLELLSGGILVDTQMCQSPFEFTLLNNKLFCKQNSTLLVELQNNSADIFVLKGEVGLMGSWGKDIIKVGSAFMLRDNSKGPTSIGKDFRELDLSFTPSRFEISPWSADGGSGARTHRGIAEFSGKLKQITHIENPTAISGSVITPTGQPLFMLWSDKTNLATIDNGQLKILAAFPDTFIGSPVIALNGDIFVSGRTAIWQLKMGAVEFTKFIKMEDGNIPRDEPLLAQSGGLVLMGTKGLSCYSATGKKLWQRGDIKSAKAPSWGNNNIILTATLSGKLLALSFADGKELGTPSAPVNEAFLTSVAVSPQGVAVAVSAQRYLLIRDVDGTITRIELPSDEYVLPPAISATNDIVIASASGSVYRLGARAKESPKTTWFSAGTQIIHGPIVDSSGAVALWLSGGQVVIVEANTKRRWFDIDFAKCSAPAVSKTGEIFFITSDGRVFGD